MTQNTSHAVMAQRNEPADSLDFFPTPPWATRALCEFLGQCATDLGQSEVWEPACGKGHMSRVLGEYFKTVYSSDVDNYGYAKVMDYLKTTEFSGLVDWIITNPPFNLAEKFALKAIQEANEGCALLVRTSFLEGGGRYVRLFEPHPPTYILQFTERVPMHKGRLLEKGSTATSYCWLIWFVTATIDEPTLCWTGICRKKLERDGDYERDQKTLGI